ncbi:hypothetical protein BKA80DRAFT_257234 [Phyllosticta citrichinensis]
MRLSNIIHLFLQCLLLSGTIAVPLHLLETSGPPLFELFLEENGEFVPLNRSDPLHMPPEPSYKGLPMKTQWNEYNEVQHVVQIELLDIHTYRKHFLAGPSWQDLELSDEDVEDIRQSHFNESYDPEPYAEAKMKKLMKRDPYYITPVPCTDGTEPYIWRANRFAILLKVHIQRLCSINLLLGGQYRQRIFHTRKRP